MNGYPLTPARVRIVEEGLIDMNSVLGMRWDRDNIIENLEDLPWLSGERCGAQFIVTLSLRMQDVGIRDRDRSSSAAMDVEAIISISIPRLAAVFADALRIFAR